MSQVQALVSQLLSFVMYMFSCMCGVHVYALYCFVTRTHNRYALNCLGHTHKGCFHTCLLYNNLDRHLRLFSHMFDVCCLGHRHNVHTCEACIDADIYKRCSFYVFVVYFSWTRHNVHTHMACIDSDIHVRDVFTHVCCVLTVIVTRDVFTITHVCFVLF